MPELSFSQPERRSYLLPILVVLGIAGVAFGLIFWLTPHKIAEVTVTKTQVLPIHTVFGTDTIKVGARPIEEDDLYVVLTVKVEDKLKLPIFIKDLTGTLTSAEGAELTSSASQKNDLEPLYQTFPKLKPLASAPLLRETQIAPGSSAEGMVLLHYPVPQKVWDSRTAATVTVDTYHQGPLTVAIPK